MKTRSSNVGLLIALSLIPTAVIAEEMGYYGRVDVGYSWSQDAGFTNQPTTAIPQITGNLQKIGNSAVLGAGVGYRFNNNFRGDATYNRRGGFRLDSNDSQLTSTNYTSDITADTVMLNGYWNFDLATSSVKPYAGLGLGWSRNKMGALTYTDPGFAGGAPGGTSSNFAWQLMAGADVALSKSTTLDIGYHYVDLGDIKTDAGTNALTRPAPATFVADGIKGNLRAHELQVGMRFKF